MRPVAYKRSGANQPSAGDGVVLGEEEPVMDQGCIGRQPVSHGVDAGGGRLHRNGLLR